MDVEFVEQRSRVRQFLIAGAFVGVAVVSFVVGRSTATDGPAATSPNSCAPAPLAKANVPDGFGATGNLGYFSDCELRAAANAAPLGEPFPPIEMFSDPEGTTVIGMWYSDCGFPEGLVHPDAGRPACDTVGTTGQDEAP